MNAAEFIAKWRRVALTERSASQQHFLDLCELLDHPKPAAADPVGESFCFERGAAKTLGGDGWADVWKKGFFGWEYKGRKKDLDTAYKQLLLYREDLENPPLLVVCDMDRIEVHTNFTNTPKSVYRISLDDLGAPRSLEVLRAVFHDPERLRPGVTSQAITEEAARHIGEIAQALRDRGFPPERVAHFLDRVVFCMFAEDVGLLPACLFSRVVANARHDPPRLTRQVEQLFAAMATGGDFGAEVIRHFDGNLFTPDGVLPLTEAEIASIHRACELDWSTVDPSIFGTLFERGLDPDKRSQLGAHYTSREDIETLVEPVVMAPLRRQWAETRELVENLLQTGRKKPTGNEKRLTGAQLRKAHTEADLLLQRFLGRLAAVKVLDPACGSGNFLYVTLQKLKDLEKEVSTFAADRGFSGLLPLVGPWQLHGIEINRYAFELAQMTVWIGYLQWIRFNGFEVPADPILRPMDTFHCMDAILDLSDPENPAEPDWPAVDYIVGNPPFLGGKRIRGELGHEYFEALTSTYHDRLPEFSDLCCYWFERARTEMQQGRCKRAGLLATQGIRGGANRRVLERIKASGEVFWAQSDRPWILDGANVHISMVGFDDGTETERWLDGLRVTYVNTNLTAAADTTLAKPLAENAARSFIGIQKGGGFDLAESEALSLLLRPNPRGRPNSDVLRPFFNAVHLLQRAPATWIVDFGARSLEGASSFEAPFELVSRNVKPYRQEVRRERHKREWWRFAEIRQGYRVATGSLVRIPVTPHVAKHSVVAWLDTCALPSNLLIAVALDDDYFFGVLHSRVHEVWALRQGTRLETRPRYTPTTCFETFPFPWPPGQEPADDPRRQAIAAAARELDELRRRWLDPPEWVTEEVLEFPGSVDGPWARYVHDPDQRGIGTVRWPRLVPRDEACATRLKARTLTKLYNQRPAWLALAHDKLDAAVVAAYGWDPTMNGEALLEALLALNLERAGR